MLVFLRLPAGVCMYDFTWKSLFKVCAVVAVPSIVIAMSGTHDFSLPTLIGYIIVIPMLFACILLVYGAIAPILAYTTNSYRETRSVWQTVQRILGLCLALAAVALLMWAITVGSDTAEAWLADKPWGWIITGIVGVLTLFGYALNLYDAYRIRKQINSLHTYTPSDSRKVAAER
jgi:hypothetical protein